MWDWDCTIRNIPCLVPFCVIMEGWLLMLWKYSSAPRDTQNIGSADHFSSMSTQLPSTDNYIVWLSQPFITLSVLLGPHMSLSGKWCILWVCDPHLSQGLTHSHWHHVYAVHMQSNWSSPLKWWGRNEGNRGGTKTMYYRTHDETLPLFEAYSWHLESVNDIAYAWKNYWEITTWGKTRLRG